MKREDFITASKYCFENFTDMTKYYDDNQRYSKLRFRAYVNKQKASNEMSNRLLAGSYKYRKTYQIESSPKKWKRLPSCDREDEANKPIIIAYGATKFSSLRGNVQAPARLFRKVITRFVKQRNRRVFTLLVPVDEYLTSQVCPKCQKRSTEKEKNTSDMKLHPVLICEEEECATRWNRDHMASLNMRTVFLYMVKHKDERPTAFKERKLSLNLSSV